MTKRPLVLSKSGIIYCIYIYIYTCYIAVKKIAIVTIIIVHELGNLFLTSDDDCMNQVLQFCNPILRTLTTVWCMYFLLFLYSVLPWINPVNSLQIRVCVYESQSLLIFCSNPVFLGKSQHFPWLNHVKSTFLLVRSPFSQWNQHFSWLWGFPWMGVPSEWMVYNEQSYKDDLGVPSGNLT